MGQRVCIYTRFRGLDCRWASCLGFLECQQGKHSFPLLCVKKKMQDIHCVGLQIFSGCWAGVLRDPRCAGMRGENKGRVRTCPSHAMQPLFGDRQLRLHTYARYTWALLAGPLLLLCTVLSQHSDWQSG
jgi:hypothetical protein